MLRYLAIGILASAQLAVAQTARLTVRVDNAHNFARESETIALPWTLVVRELRGVTATQVRVIEIISERELTAQVLDANADGQPDSLLFQVSLAPNDVKQFLVEAVAPGQKQTQRAHVKFVPEREDVAWESDRIAFRIYGKKLWELENLHTNGIDVWPKRTRALVLDAWYAKGHDGYHIDTGEGADFYQVGNTLGTGGTGVWKDQTLYRGDNFLAHRIIADGPIRAIFELDYGPIEAAGTTVTERKRVSIDGGQQLFRQESTFDAFGVNAKDAEGLGKGRKGEVEIAVGLVKRPGVIGSMSKARDWAWLTGWGPIEPRTRGHGNLGIAVLIHRSQLVELKEIDDHYLAIGRIPAGGTLVSYAGAGWTASRDFEHAEDWWNYVDNFAQRLANPVTVTIMRAGQVVRP